MITIKSVQLKKDTGEWITVIEPDHQVDLVSQEATVSFFNNGRRVPPTNYGNFRIIFIDRDTNHEIQLLGQENFKQALKVSTRSFISVSFELNLAATLQDSSVKRATIAVDDQTLVIPGESIRMVF